MTYGEIFEALQRSFPGWDVPSDYQDYGPIAVRELQCVFNWKAFFSGCRSSKLSGTLFPRAGDQKLKPHVFRVTRRDHNGIVEAGVESYITGLDFMQNESRLLEWTPIFRKYPDFQQIPVDMSMFSVFHRDKWVFCSAIVGSGFSVGARQGLVLSQVHYYRSFCLPELPDIHDPFLLQSASFRSREPAPLVRVSKRRKVVNQGDESEEEDDRAGNDAEFEIVQVLQLKLKHGTDGQVCYVQFADGSMRWVSRSDVPDMLVRDFQHLTRQSRRQNRPDQPVVQEMVVCDCGRAFATKHAMNIHSSKTKNEICKKNVTNWLNCLDHAQFVYAPLADKDVLWHLVSLTQRNDIGGAAQRFCLCIGACVVG